MSQRKLSKQISNYTNHKSHQTNVSPMIKKCAKSPLSNSKCTNPLQNKQNVSYGELQIVLQNIQHIRQKAAAQVSQLTYQNKDLKQQITRQKTQIQEITAKLRAESGFQGQLQLKWRQRVQEVQQQIRIKDLHIQEREKIIRNCEEKNKELQIILVKDAEKLSVTTKQLQQFRKKWIWAFKILAGDDSKAQELVWRVKNSNYNLWDIIQTYLKLMSVIDAKNERIQGLNEDLKEAKQNVKQSSKMLQISLSELNFVNSKLDSSEKEARQLSEKCKIIEQSLKNNGKIYQKELGIAKDRSKMLEEQIKELQQKVLFFSNQLALKQDQLSQKSEKEDYQKIISQACDESEDYQKILERLKYLQKFRREHYFNVEKIQYLCKILDS